MKHPDTLLVQHQPTPTRPLKNNFTQTIVSELNARPEAAGAYTKLSRLRSRLLTRAGLLTLGGSLLLAGGTAMAVVLWPTPSVTTTTRQELPSGNHIVGYDLKNCDYFDKLNGATPTNTDDKVYYEVRQDSNLTDDQLQNALQGMCEEHVDGTALSPIMQHLSSTLAHGDFSTEVLTVNAITKDGITVSLDSHYAPTSSQVKPDLTYTQFSHELLVYDQTAKTTYDSLHLGDSVMMVLHQNSNPQGVAPGYYVAENDPSNITILAIVKVPPLTADPSTIYGLFGGDIVRLDPCTTSPTGFCRAYDFISPSSPPVSAGQQPSGWTVTTP
ncbi:MAG TPA: hypothetical protein VLE99_02900 [Candidatus Saccharimonadales bacterium]|nr:hypothetical protein [Candidatus Saccharimonadales bacterium]